jgi:hypothetical protein
MPPQPPATPARLCLLLLGLGDLNETKGKSGGEGERRWVDGLLGKREGAAVLARGLGVASLCASHCLTDNAGPPWLVTREISRPKHYTRKPVA